MADEYVGMEQNLNKLTNMCNANLTGDNGCRVISTHLSKRLRDILQTNLLIFGSGRSKRALLNIVGNVASELFGVLNSNFAEQYAKDMTFNEVN